MELEQHITKYLESSDYTQWSLLGLLQYLSERINYTHDDAITISDIFRQNLKSKSIDRNTFKYARAKAEKLARNLDINEITQFLEGFPQSLQGSQDQQEDRQDQQDKQKDKQDEFLQILVHDYSTFLEQRKNCDLKIRTTNNQIFEVHSAILCARSSFFREVLLCNRVQYEISIPDVTPKSFKTLLKYIYCGVISLDDYESSEIFDLCLAATKLDLKEVVNYLKEML